MLNSMATWHLSMASTAIILPKTEVYDEKFAQWQKSHQPFHWWIEFYGIMKRGGFDVIIGNPPYVEYEQRKEHIYYRGSKYSEL